MSFVKVESLTLGGRPDLPRLRYGVILVRTAYPATKLMVVGVPEGGLDIAARDLRYMIVGGHNGDLDFAALELQPPHRIMSIPVETVTGRYPLYQVEEEA